jgi:hypothetical protein
MADFTAPWDSAFQVGVTGQGATDRGFTEPSVQESADVQSAAQNASPEQGSGPQYEAATIDEFEPGLSLSPVDQTPYQPPGVGPSMPWDATPAETVEIHGQDHGASEFFNSDVRPATGHMSTRDNTVGSFSTGIETDNYGRTILTDIDRPEHNISQVNTRDPSYSNYRLVGYEERPQFNNIAVPAPYIESAAPSAYTPDGSYPDLSPQQRFNAEMYVTPPDPAQSTPAYGTYTEPQGEFE